MSNSGRNDISASNALPKLSTLAVLESSWSASSVTRSGDDDHPAPTRKTGERSDSLQNQHPNPSKSHAV